MQNLRWTDDGKRSAAVCERDFTIERRGKAIPGVVWQPLRATGAQPLVLMGHGGTGHKRSDKLTRMAEIFTTGYGSASCGSGYDDMPLVTKPYQMRDLGAAIERAMGL